LFKWDPAANRLTNLGMALQYDSIKDVEVDHIGGLIYAVSYPQVRFLVYDVKKNILRDLGRMGSDHVPRVMFRDWWSNGYYVDWRQRLVKYERNPASSPSRRKPARLSRNSGNRIVTGVTAYAIDQPNGVIYLITYGSKMIAFRPKKTGIGSGKISAVSTTIPRKRLTDITARTLRWPRTQVVLFPRGHGMYAGGAPNVALMEFDPKRKTKRVVVRYPLASISESRVRM